MKATIIPVFVIGLVIAAWWLNDRHSEQQTQLEKGSTSQVNTPSPRPPSEKNVPEIQFQQVRVKQLIPGQRVTAGYFILKNNTQSPKKLIAVHSPLAERVELHTHEHGTDGFMSMKRLDEVNIEAQEQLAFREGGHHLMIFGPDTEQLGTGVYPLEFQFESGETLHFDALVEAR